MVNEQWGFRRERSTRDVILVARIVAELSSDWERNLQVSRSRMERAGTWERNAERWEAEHKMFKEAHPMLVCWQSSGVFTVKNITHREAQIG